MPPPTDPNVEKSIARLRDQRPRHLLFLCVANSARSQMAEGIARSLAPPGTRVSSAGTEPTRLHPLAIQVMEEIGIDIREHRSKSVEEVDLETVDAVVTLCAEESCPVLPTVALLEHWPLPDPAIPGWDATDGFHVVRDELQRRLRSLFSAPSA